MGKLPMLLDRVLRCVQDHAVMSQQKLHTCTSLYDEIINLGVKVIISTSPSHLHNVLHLSPARWHLQFPLHATAQPQWSNSEHALLTSGRSVQYGTHPSVLVFHSHPQSRGLKIMGSLESDCFHTNSAVSNARLAC